MNAAIVTREPNRAPLNNMTQINLHEIHRNTISNIFRKKKHIDDTMFTLVAIQNMILEFDVTMQEFQSWDVQELNWQNVNITGIPEENVDKVLHTLEVAEEEDVDEQKQCPSADEEGSRKRCYRHCSTHCSG
jgi:hypothetical protein